MFVFFFLRCLLTFLAATLTFCVKYKDAFNPYRVQDKVEYGLNFWLRRCVCRYLLIL